MKRLVSVVSGFLLFPSLFAQDIQNVNAFQENGKAVIVYDLLSVDASKEFYVKIFCSSDGGKSFGTMLTKVSGDDNTMVKAGRNKMAVWDVLNESSSAKGEFVFKVDAISVGPNGVLPSITDRGITVQFLDIAKSGNDVSIVVSFLNKNAEAATVICANFLIIDDNDKICRDVVGANKIIQLNQGEKKTSSFIVKNVSPTSKGFSQFEFNASAVVVRLKNLPFIGTN